MTQTINTCDTFFALAYKTDERFTELRYEKNLENAVSYLDDLSYTYGVNYKMEYEEVTETYHVHWYTKDNEYITSDEKSYLPVWISKYQFGK